MERNGEEPKFRSFLPLLPFNAATAGISTLVPLAIIGLKGSVIDVGFSAMAYNLALIPAPLVWGYICDVTGARKKVVMLSSALIAVSAVGMYLTDTTVTIALLFAAIGHSAGMLAPALNLLIIESLPKTEWEKGYTFSSLYSTVGTIGGLTTGMVWSFYMPSSYFFLICAGFALVAVALTMVEVREPAVPIERRSFLLSPSAFVYRLTQVPLLFLRVPRRADFVSVVRLARQGMTRDIPVILTASALFSASLNIFFTSYTPYLKENGLSNWEVYFTSLYISAMNGLASRMLLRKAQGAVTPQMASSALAVRSLGMLLAAVFAVFLSGPLTFYATLASFTFLGVAYTVISVNLNSLFYKSLPAGRQGGLLGVYSALNGTALFVGAAVSGYISFYLGYPMTFFVSATLVLLSAAVLQAHFGGSPPPTYE